MLGFFYQRLLLLPTFVEHRIKEYPVDFVCTQPVRIKVPNEIAVYRGGVAALITTKNKIVRGFAEELRRFIWLTNRRKLTARKETADGLDINVQNTTPIFS